MSDVKNTKRTIKICFLVILLSLIGCVFEQTKTYAATKATTKTNIFASCTAGFMFGYKDVTTGKTGKATVNAAWVKKPSSRTNAIKTSQKVKITTTSGTIGNIKWTVKGGTYSTMNKESFKTTALYGSYTSSSYYYIRIPIDITVPAGYFWNGNITKNYAASFARDYRTAPEVEDNGTGNLFIKQYFTISQNQERTIHGYMVGNIAGIGLIADGSDKFTSSAEMMKATKYAQLSLFEFQYMPYNVEYKPGNDATGDEYTDKKYVGQSSSLRGKTYTRNHYYQIGWTGYTQYAKNINDTAKTCDQGKHYEEYSLNQSISAPGYSEDGYFRRNKKGTGDDFGCSEDALNDDTESKIVLEPKWQANTFKIHYNKNNSSATLKDGITEDKLTSTVTYNDGSKLASDVYFYRYGYHVKEWQDSDGKTYSLGESINSLNAEDGATVELNAVWERDSTDVTFNADGGKFSDNTSVKTKNVLFNTVGCSSTIAISIQEKPGVENDLYMPTKDGYRFAGFYTGRNRTGKLIFNNNGACVNDGTVYLVNRFLYVGDKLTLYAGWVKITDPAVSQDQITVSNWSPYPPSAPPKETPIYGRFGLKVEKLDDETQKPIQNVEFSLKNLSNDTSKTFVTDENGIAKTENSALSTGEYELSETSAPEQYEKSKINPMPWKISAVRQNVTDTTGKEHAGLIVTITDANGDVVTKDKLSSGDYSPYTMYGVIAYNHDVRQTLKLTKKDSENNEILAGTEFTLTGNGYSKTEVANAEGEVKFTELLPGEYMLKETKAPIGYELPSDNEHIVTVTKNTITIK